MIFEDQRRELVETLHELQRLGLVIGTAGNVSVRLDAGRFLVSPSGIRYSTMGPADVCVIDADGTLIDGNHLPTSETRLHLTIYETSEHRAIVHTHSSAAVAVSSLVDEVPPHHYYISNFGDQVRVAKYHTFGTLALADAVREALGSNLGALMANHGAVVVGPDLVVATERASLLEWLCRTWLDAASAGLPALLTPEQLAEVRNRRTRSIYDEIAATNRGEGER